MSPFPLQHQKKAAKKPLVSSSVVSSSSLFKLFLKTMSQDLITIQTETLAHILSSFPGHKRIFSWVVVGVL